MKIRSFFFVILVLFSAILSCRATTAPPVVEITTVHVHPAPIFSPPDKTALTADEFRALFQQFDHPVTWSRFTEDADVLTACYESPRVVILFGADWCDACAKTIEWWKTRRVPKNWRFIYWNQGEGQTLESKKMRLFLHEVAKRSDQKMVFPTVVVLDGAYPGVPLSYAVDHVFYGGSAGTVGLSWYLLEKELARLDKP